MSVLVMVATAVTAVDIHDCLYFCIGDGGGGGGGVGWQTRKTAPSLLEFYFFGSLIDIPGIKFIRSGTRRSLS
jgi:hypothetical protein